MKKYLFAVGLFWMACHFAAAQDMSNDPVGGILQNVETNIRLFSDNQELLLANVKNTLNDDNPAFSKVLELRDNGMAKLFVFDEKHIMCKEVSYENRIFSSKILNQHYVGLRKAEIGKIYLSPMFLYKNKAYYLLGAKNEAAALMLLFIVPEAANKHYAIFHDDGTILINKMGLNKAKIAELTKIITEGNSEKFEKISKNAFTVFRPTKKYYIINEEN